MIEQNQNQPEADDDDGDPIVAEVRRAREALFAKFGYDLRALGEHLQQRTEEAAHAGRKVVTLPPRRPQPHTPPAKKVG